MTETRSKNEQVDYPKAGKASPRLISDVTETIVEAAEKNKEFDLFVQLRKELADAKEKHEKQEKLIGELKRNRAKERKKEKMKALRDRSKRIAKYDYEENRLGFEKRKRDVCDDIVLVYEQHQKDIDSFERNVTECIPVLSAASLLTFFFMWLTILINGFNDRRWQGEMHFFTVLSFLGVIAMFFITVGLIFEENRLAAARKVRSKALEIALNGEEDS